VGESRSRRQDAERLLLATGAVAALVLGYVGYRVAGTGYSPTDALFGSLQLFVLEGGIVEGGTPWPLDVARFLAPAVLAFAAIRVILLLIRERAMRWSVRLFARDHAVVIGATDTALAIATGLAAGGMRTVAIEQEALSPRTAAYRERGIAVVAGDVTDAAVLSQARPDRATVIVIAGGDDSLSLRALAACAEATNLSNRALQIHVEVIDARLWTELHTLGLARSDRTSVEFFSAADRGARALLDAAQAELARANDSLHVIVAGAGAIIPRLLVHLVRRAAAADADLSVSPAGACASDEFMRALEDAPWLATSGVHPRAPQEPSPQLGFVCGLDDAKALAAAAQIGREVTPAASVWTAISDPALGHALDASRLDLRRINLVPATAVALGASLLSESAVELIARAKHEDYVARELERGRTNERNPSVVAWSVLPESLRASNILFARDVANKLAAVGASLAPLTTAAGTYDLPLEARDLEPLARGEHDRWVHDLIEDGWRFTDGQKDPERKLHPLLMPWEELDEEEREKDRDAFRALPRLLARAGYEVVTAKAVANG
jgi:voltage-gated potassium channel Kch